MNSAQYHMTIGSGPAYLFSSGNSKNVDRHFRWMQQYALDGVLLQRFVTKPPRRGRSERRYGRRRSQGRLELRDEHVPSDFSFRVPARERQAAGVSMGGAD